MNANRQYLLLNVYSIDYTLFCYGCRLALMLFSFIHFSCKGRMTVKIQARNSALFDAYRVILRLVPSLFPEMVNNICEKMTRKKVER